ncbi:hypothetical protein [Rosistilla ulvae]|nr:hypothetical protein [Rosistilla ulvae]
MRKAWNEDPSKAAGAAMHKLLCELSDAYLAQLRPFSYRIGVNALVIVSALLSFGLASLGVWSWVAIGPAIVFATFATGAALGGVARRRVLVAKLWQWMRVWRWYELAAGALIALLLLGLVVATPIFWSVLLGTIVGSGTAAIYFLGVVLPARQELQRIERRAHQVVDGIARTGIDPWAIRAGLPRLMGDDWMPLYEALFGHDELSNARMQINADNGLPPRTTWSPRDHALEFLLAQTLQRQGPITWLRSCRIAATTQTSGSAPDAQQTAAATHLHSGGNRSGEIAVASSRAKGSSHELATRDQTAALCEASAEGKDVKMNVTIQSDKLSIGSLNASQVMLQLDSRELMDALPELVERADKAKRQEKRTKIKSMLAEARNGGGEEQVRRSLGDASTDDSRLADRKSIWLGSRSRLLTAGALLLLAAGWVGIYLAHHQESFGQLSELVAQLRSGASDFGNSIHSVGEMFTKSEPTWLPPAALAIALLPGGLVLLGSSFLAGWRISLFAYPAAILAIAGSWFNKPLIGNVMLWHLSFALAALLVAGGYWYCQRMPNQTTTRSKVDGNASSTP